MTDEEPEGEWVQCRCGEKFYGENCVALMFQHIESEYEAGDAVHFGVTRSDRTWDPVKRPPKGVTRGPDGVV